MSQRRTGDLKLIQELNRSIVFETIRKHGPISRSQIAKQNHISPTTVTSTVNELMKNGLVSEGETGISSGGRKPILVQFSPNNRFVIGVSLTNSMITIGKLNLKPEVCEKQCYDVEDRKGEALIEYLLDLISGFLKKVSDLDKCIGISIIAPGTIDYENGIIHYNSKLMLIDVPLRKMVEKQFNLKTWLDNDTNAIALAEKEIGDYKRFKNLLNIVVDDGVGAAFVLDGSVFRGHKGGAGEFGHTIVERGGVRCECGNRGCIGNYVSWPSIYSRIVSAVAKKEYTHIPDIVNHKLEAISPSILLTAWKEGDRLAIDILDDTASYLSTGIINLVNLFNPDAVVLSGKVVEGNDVLVSKVTEIVMNQGVKTNINELIIGTSSLGVDYELIGAANMALHEQFAFSLSNTQHQE